METVSGGNLLDGLRWQQEEFKVAEQDKGIHFALFFRLHILVAVKGTIRTVAKRHFAGVLSDQLAGIEARDLARPGLTIQNSGPAGLHAIGQRSYQSQTCHYYSAHIQAPWCFFALTGYTLPRP